jgi:leucyl aminopeptidase
LEYIPPKPTDKEDFVALIGKGVTFDSGGISLKPNEGMEEMKADMAGAAVVLGVMKAVAELKPNIRVLAVAPCVENMPGGSAIRPGDVVYAMNGKSVEIVNTDAEGRLILADALCYAQTRKPHVILDIATLTGACKVALGTVYAGLFATEEQLAKELLALGPLTGEKLWRLPLDPEYRRGLKSDIADLRNIGNRWGGAIYGAMFLENFVIRTPWAHLDIGGVDWQTEAAAHQAKGATGFGFHTLLEFLLQKAKRS